MADATVCVTYDFDAVSAWLSFDMPGFHRWGVYGARVAAPRLLDLHDEYGVPATWFVPGHTIESFPEVCGDVWDRGYEIQHHGWTHESPSAHTSREAEKADVERGIDAIYDLTGRKPTGYRTPAGGFSEHTIDILGELGFEWDSSDSAHDFRPYYLRKPGRVTWDEPYEEGERTDLVEVPLVWHRDDWMQLFPVVSGTEWVAYSTEGQVFERWRTELDWMVENVEDGVLVLLLHPQCSGRAPFLTRLEAFLSEVDGRPDVGFADVGTVVDRFEA